eukprot:gb/GFBE01007243.1/.p1 GENE.gb/GFBE01007243.1/~~gb/GFBE01007243.1/.p1  ORF type:complete len:319 (+),score=62.89 gb/GFBE01007243.1/:1-957(+)
MTAFSPEDFAAQLASLRAGSMTCDLGVLSQVNKADNESVGDAASVLSRSQSSESHRAASVSSEQWGAASDVKHKFEAELLEGIQSLQDKNIGRVFSMFLTYVQQMKPAIVKEVKKDVYKCNTAVKQMEDKVSKLSQQVEQQQKEKPGAGRTPAWLAMAKSSGRSALQHPRQSSRTPHSDLLANAGSLPPRSGSTGSSTRPAAAPKLPSWLRSSAGPGPFQPKSRPQSIPEAQAEEREEHDPEEEGGSRHSEEGGSSQKLGEFGILRGRSLSGPGSGFGRQFSGPASTSLSDGAPPDSAATEQNAHAAGQRHREDAAGT